MYTAFVLTRESQEALKALVGSLVPQGFSLVTKEGSPLCHHVTINMGGFKVELNPTLKLGQMVHFRVTGFGLSELAAAVTVATDVAMKTASAFLHSTVAIGEKGKPFNSNQIPAEAFKAVGELEVEGVLTEVE